ncbi:hypothetical protein LARV_02740 [Longilinea arvoryzae]|uniref:Transcobalamin-like C-terminal domain-containing protein n=1 Tax=Longilinea arvoryzae TaxID=360412 RepID=A0A0S7BII8_9CHLR|nr:DUF4430 domain-containing protein [Longilinea arvoryzae]GAP14960.1 hypothetical protein LARV_02740 [Longilinea arvoryzae]
MKKRSVLLVVLVLVLISTFMAGCAPKNAADEWKWTPGKDEVTYKSTAADEWSPTFTVYVKIVGGNDTVLYDGKVTLTSPQMMASEFLSAAISEKGLAQEGLDVGFITKVGDYENDSTNNVYWMYYVNGAMPNWGTNEFRLRDGDYVKLAYEKYQQQ